MQVVAARAGLSRRALFNHFSSVDALYFALVDLQRARILAVTRHVDPQLPLDERLDGFASTRAELYEFISPMRRAAVIRARDSTVIADALRDYRKTLRTRAHDLFAAELAALPRGVRRARRHALGAVSAWSCWASWRTEQQLSVDDARTALRESVASLLR